MASKPLYIVIAAAGIAAASGAAWWYQNKSSAARGSTSQAATGAPPAAGPAAGGPARPPAVEVARVETVKLTDDAQAVGTLRSRQGVMLRPEVSGRVTQLNFRDGDRVTKGQLLVQLDDQLPQAQAELSITTSAT